MISSYKRENDITLMTVLTALLALGFYVMSFFSATPDNFTFSKDLVLNILFNQPAFSHPGTLSAIIAAAFTTINCFSLYYVGEKVLPDKSIISFIPLTYLMLTTAMPEARFFTPYHIVTLMMIWAFYCVVNFRMNERNIEGLFLSILLVSVASLFYLPMLWFTLLLILVNLSAEMDKLRYLLITITAIVTPYIIYFGLIYLFWNLGEVQAKFAICLYYLKDIDIISFRSNHPAIIFASILGLATIISSVAVLANLDKAKVIIERAYVRIIIVLLGMIGISIVYGGSLTDLSGIMVFFPIPFLLFDFYTERAKKVPATIFFLIIAGALTYLKISQLA
ncbi:MAG: hypothetical protein QMB59_04700 [Bacteroidales bacterium]